MPDIRWDRVARNRHHEVLKFRGKHVAEVFKYEGRDRWWYKAGNTELGIPDKTTFDSAYDFTSLASAQRAAFNYVRSNMSAQPSRYTKNKNAAENEQPLYMDLNFSEALILGYVDEHGKAIERTADKPSVFI